MSEPKENQASLKKAVEADVLVAQDGKIVYIGSDAQGKIENANKVIDAIGKWLLPGFVSAHSHLRQHGLAARAPNSDVAEWSTVVANAVRLSKPANMYVITFKGRSEPAQFEAALDASIRFVHGFNIGQVTNIWPENGALARTATFQGRSLAKHAPDHFLGSKMVLQGLEYEDKRTIATEACIKKRFNLEGHIGYLESPGPKKSPLAMQSHFLHICTASEIAEEAAKAGMRMIWNLLVNGRLGSGVFDLPKDIPIGLGTDGEAAVQQSQKSAGALDPHEIYCMHTPGAAQVLNIAGRGGSLEKGKLADMILFKPPDTRDYRKGYVSILVSASGIEDIESVFIGGLEEWPHIRPVPPPVDDDRWKHWHV